MSTTYTSKTKLGIPALGDTGWNVPLAADINALDAMSPLGGLCVTLHEVPSTTLTVAVAAGSFISSTGTLVTYAGAASQSLTASQTSYVWLTDAGVLTTGTAWPSSPTYFVPLAIVVAGSSTITSVTDARVVCRSLTV